MSDPDDHYEEQSDVDSADLAAIRQAMGELADSPAQPSAPAVEFIPQFPDLESWVNGFFVLTFARPGGEACWCERWWDHPEAVLRLDALWRTWEAAALDPVHGVADWLRDYLDPGLSVLLSPAGPFAGCREGTHAGPSALPVSPTPPKWWSTSNWWEMLTDPDR
jgi:uncharacterized protein DUF4913